MTCKLYVGNIPFSAQEDSLRDLFAQSGTVESVKIVTDPHDGRSKGFGFVEMATDEEADDAIQKMNGHELDGRTIRVDKARPKENRGGGGRGGGGGRRPFNRR
ncbi:MAG: hypothetical protein IEMM0002_0001 [bacterium]|nr:MAG: hypothetical protein IEMM0002_0001 [bacterium]